MANASAIDVPSIVYFVSLKEPGLVIESDRIRGIET